MIKKIVILCIFFHQLIMSQVRMTSVNLSSVNSSAFIDASSNTTNNLSLGVGKGLVFPRVDLSNFSFVGTSGLPNNFPSRFDGMLVYNTATGGIAASGNTEGSLSPGFWYYKNTTTSSTGGTWSPLVASSQQSINDISPIEITLPLKIGGSQLYAVKGSFIANGVYAMVTIPKPTGMTSHYGIVILKDGKFFRNQIISFDVTLTTDNVTTGFGNIYEVYPSGTYEYVLEYFK
jgi:hypothetical protein